MLKEKYTRKQKLPFQKDITVEQLLKLDDPFHSVGKDPMWTVLGHVENELGKVLCIMELVVQLKY